VSAGTTGCKVAEDAAQQSRLKETVGFGSQLQGAFAIPQSFTFQQSPEVFGHLLLKLFEVFNGLRIGELTEFFKVDDCQLCVLAGVLELLQQFVNFLQLGVDLNSLIRRHRLTPGELVAGCEHVNEVFAANHVDQTG